MNEDSTDVLDTLISMSSDEVHRNHVSKLQYWSNEVSGNIFLIDVKYSIIIIYWSIECLGRNLWFANVEV